MRLSRAASVGALGASAVVGHVWYPLALGLLARKRPERPLAQDPDPWPSVSVIIPAYLEAGVIADKVGDVLASDYPASIEVIVVAEDDETASAAKETGVVVLQPEERLGKSQALNLGVDEAKHDLLVLTDANNRLSPRAIRLIVLHLLSGYSAAAGEKVSSDDGGERSYWRFESWVKRQEHKLGSTVGVCGELFGVRRDAWRPIPKVISSDDLWMAIDLMERGHSIAYVSEARAYEPPTRSAEDQWERRTRIVAGRMFVLRHKLGAFRPLRNPLLFGEVMGHMFWRTTLGPLSHAGLLVVSLVKAPRSKLARLFLAGHVIGAVGIWANERRMQLPLVVSAPVQGLKLNAIALAGMARAARGDRVLRWPKLAR